MKTGLHPHLRRSLSVAAAAIVAVALTSCTGRGGGQLPPAVGFAGPASFGFSFSCEDKGGLNPQPGRLHIELSYTDHGRSLFLGSSFSIHGTADTIDPVLESQFCSGQNPPPPPENQLIFLGRYRLTSSAPAGFRSTCRETATTPLCRFEVIVQDNDMNGAPSPRDWFQIKLSSATAVTSELEPAAVFYTRGGALSSGNLTVD